MTSLQSVDRRTRRLGAEPRSTASPATRTSAKRAFVKAKRSPAARTRNSASPAAGR